MSDVVGAAVFNFANCIATALGPARWPPALLATCLSLTGLVLTVVRRDLGSSDICVETESVEGNLDRVGGVCDSSIFADCSFCRRTMCSLIMSESDSSPLAP